MATIGTVLRPEVRYARTDDDVTIGYWVAVTGPVTMVVVSLLTGKSLPRRISGAGALRALRDLPAALPPPRVPAAITCRGSPLT